jgi:flagellar basal body rod protein FlgC
VRRKLKFEANAADPENCLLLCADYKEGMGAILSIAAEPLAASSHRHDASPHNVANGSASVPSPTPPASSAAPVSNTAPASNQAGGANAQGPARASHVDATGVSPGAAAASAATQPTPSVVVDYDPRSPYGPTNGVPPSADLASEMIQQLVAYYPFTANGQVHADTPQTVDFKT